MNHLFEKNISLLNEKFPSVVKKLENLKHKHETKLKKPSRHDSIYTEVQAIDRIEVEKYISRELKNLRVEEGIIFLFLGIGMARHIEKFLELYGENALKAKIILVEKNPETFFHLINTKDIEFLIKPSITLMIGENIGEVTSLFESISPVYFRGYRIVKHPVLYERDTEYYQAIENNFKSLLGAVLTDLFTRYFFEPLWFKNIILNTPHLSKAIPLRVFKDRFHNVPAIVVGAGPSLKRDIENIMNLSKKYCIIATDTALRTLICSKIVPHFVVTLDAQYHSIMDFQNLGSVGTERSINTRVNNKKPLLIADLSCYPGVLKLGIEKISLIKSMNVSSWDTSGEASSYEVSPLYRFIARYTDRIDGLACGGSVITTCTEFALYGGFSPIVICGIDLSYPDYLTHVVSSPYHRKSIVDSNRTSTIINYHTGNLSKRKLLVVKNKKNHPVVSDVVLDRYREWIIKRNRYYGGKVYISTNNSTSIPGLEAIDPAKIEGKRFNAPAGKIENNVIYENPAEILTDLKRSLSNANEWLNKNNLDSEVLDIFLNNYDFLRTITPVFLRFYKKYETMQMNLKLFLEMCIKTADKAMRLLGK